MKTKVNNNNHIVSKDTGDQQETQLNKLVEELRHEIAQEEQMDKHDFHEDILAKFLRAKMYNVRNALASIRLYVSALVNTPELFKTPLELKAAFDNDVISFLPEKHPVSGESILYTRTGRWDPSKFPFDTFIAATALTLEVGSCDPDIQSRGIIDIVDMKDFGWRQMKSFGPFQAKLTNDLTDKILPIRFNQIHVINESYLAKMAYSLMKPFMSEEYTKKIHFHGSDLSKLYAAVPRELLPSELGGGKRSHSCKLWFETLLERQTEVQSQWDAILRRN
ncbi:Alpha-tocopherol transfer protein-like [Halotydeus destructor]|nr:Alpha-tocopherol transfer protein-like [Halotydeus destructor]